MVFSVFNRYVYLYTNYAETNIVKMIRLFF